MVKNTFHSSRRPEFSSQYPHSNLQLSTAPVPGDPMPVWPHWAPWTHVVHSWTCKQNISAQIKKINKQAILGWAWLLFAKDERKAVQWCTGLRREERTDSRRFIEIFSSPFPLVVGWLSYGLLGTGSAKMAQWVNVLSTVDRIFFRLPAHTHTHKKKSTQGLIIYYESSAV